MFTYLNVNPKGKRTGDCVIRATALALGVEWECASDMLYEQARECACEMSCLGCYSQLFEMLGFCKHNAAGKSVQEVANEHPDNTVIIRCKGHLTCAIKSRVHDIWDCSREIADCYWIAD
jgi:hypothetical protein